MLLSMFIRTKNFTKIINYKKSTINRSPLTFIILNVLVIHKYSSFFCILTYSEPSFICHSDIKNSRRIYNEKLFFVIFSNYNNNVYKIVNKTNNKASQTERSPL